MTKVCTVCTFFSCIPSSIFGRELRIGVMMKNGALLRTPTFCDSIRCMCASVYKKRYCWGCWQELCYCVCGGGSIVERYPAAVTNISSYSRRQRWAATEKSLKTVKLLENCFWQIIREEIIELLQIGGKFYAGKWRSSYHQKIARARISFF